MHKKNDGLTPAQRYRQKIANDPIAKAKKKLLNKQRYVKKVKEIRKPDFKSVAECDKWYIDNFNMRVS